MEGKGFRDRIQDFTSQNCLVVGISCDTPAENRLFKEKFNFPFDLLSDPSRETAMAYGAADSPDTEYPARISYLIDENGRIAKAYAKVVPSVHPEEVLADLAAPG